MRSIKRVDESGYALIIAAICIVLLAIATSAVVHVTAAGAAAGKFDADAEQASSIANSGLEWSISTENAGTQPFSGGSFTVVRGPGRRVESTGTYGDAVRVAVCETTLFYVPDSRYTQDGDQVSFEVYNKTGATVDVTGLKVDLSRIAFYGSVRLKMFADPTTGAPSVDYGTVWAFGTGARAASGETVTFSGGARSIPAGRHVFVELTGFRTSATGGAAVDMDGEELRVSFRDAAGPLAPTGVPRVEP